MVIQSKKSKQKTTHSIRFIITEQNTSSVIEINIKIKKSSVRPIFEAPTQIISRKQITHIIKKLIRFNTPTEAVS